MNTIADLRSHLFETLRALRNRSDGMEIERAKAISEVAQVIINSAKVEVEHLRVTGGKGTGFISDTRTELLPAPTAHGSKSVTPLGNGSTLTRHTMGGKL